MESGHPLFLSELLSSLICSSVKKTFSHSTLRRCCLSSFHSFSIADTDSLEVRIKPGPSTQGGATAPQIDNFNRLENA